jgi:NAD(P)H dehydrogenase (quinone)
VLVRDAAKGKALGCDYVVGDFDDAASIAAALVGVAQLFLNVNATGSMVRQQTGAIDAAKTASVSHIVKVSTIGSNATSSMSIPKWHGAVDDYLEGAGVRGSILQPCVFMQNILGQAESIKSDGRFYGAFGEGRVPFIDADDIAACAVELLMTARDGGRFALTGGSALTHAELAQQLAVKLKKSVVYVDRPVDEVVGAMKSRGMPAQFADDLGTMMGYIAKGGAPKPTSTVKDLTGRAPRTFEQFLSDNLSAFV